MSALRVIPGGLFASGSSSAGESTDGKMEVDGRDRRDACARLNDSRMRDCDGVRGLFFYFFCKEKKKLSQLEPRAKGRKRIAPNFLSKKLH